MSSDAHLGSKATERALLYTALAFRIAGLVDLATWVPVDLQAQGASHALMGVLALESAAVFLAYRRHGDIGPRRLVVGDALFIIAVMITDLALTADFEEHEWGHWIRNFVLSSLVGIAMGLRSWSLTLLAIVVFAGTYWASMLAVGGYDENLIYRAVSLVVNALGGCGVAMYLRPRAAAMDTAHLRAMETEIELARERDRSTRAGVLHDRILQTLEVLAVGDTVADPELRGHVAASATWLRTFVQDDHDELPGGLTSALCDVVGDVTRLHGLKVDFHGAQLRTVDTTTPPAIIRAVAGGVREALTNAAKHSGADLAVVHCEARDDELLISIVDQGRGFHPGDHHAGTGLDRSLTRRITDVGGHLRINSAPGAGTQVEILVPLS